jgi:hypothetical protein
MKLTGPSVHARRERKLKQFDRRDWVRRNRTEEMSELYNREFSKQARLALEKNPGQSEPELARSMGIDFDNGPDEFRRSLGLACDGQIIHLRGGKYYPGSRPSGV